MIFCSLSIAVMCFLTWLPHRFRVPFIDGIGDNMSYASSNLRFMLCFVVNSVCDFCSFMVWTLWPWN